MQLKWNYPIDDEPLPWARNINNFAEELLQNNFAEEVLQNNFAEEVLQNNFVLTAGL